WRLPSHPDRLSETGLATLRCPMPGASFVCPRCKRLIDVPSELIGRWVTCGHCQMGFAALRDEVVDQPESSTTIRLRCPSCNAAIKVPEHRAGTKGKCPRCRQLLVIPTPDHLKPKTAKILEGEVADDSPDYETIASEKSGLVTATGIVTI